MTPPTIGRKRSAIGGATGTKRARTSISVGANTVAATAAAAKAVGGPKAGASAAATTTATTEDLQAHFIALLSDPEHRGVGVSNSALKRRFGGDSGSMTALAGVINRLTTRGRLTMSRAADGELIYSLVDEEQASKFEGFDIRARMVYQVIEKAGAMGIWTKDVRTQTNIQQHALNKIFKALEARQLIKPVKAVTAKAKKLYMLYDLQPDRSITGGPWYSDLDFDYEFISELKTFILHCVRRLNNGRGVTIEEIAEKMKEANVSRVVLSLEEVCQLVSTLAYDYQIEARGLGGADGSAPLWIAARRVTSMCSFSWWDVIHPDFPYRAIKFEDGVTLAPHEPHHHTA